MAEKIKKTALDDAELEDVNGGRNHINRIRDKKDNKIKLDSRFILSDEAENETKLR